jgi:hypothetical protein
MPWDVKRDPRCAASEPFGVVKRNDKELEGCHATRAAANRQLAALNAAERGKDMADEVEEKAVQTGEIVGPGVPFGAMSFEELDAAQHARASAQMVEERSEQFRQLVGNIMANPEIEDKAAAVTTLAGEFSQRIEQAMAQKERWQPLTDKVATKVDELKARPVKTEGGVKYPASDYAYVPDKEKPSTWKLRMSAGRPGNITVAQLGRAAAAFSPGGFRGQKVQIPSNAVAGVKAKIRAAYKKLDVKPADIPDSVKEQHGGFTLWKEKDGYRWLAIYSNNYRDDDNPPEIISARAHEDFVKAVDAGEWPYPELRYWHVPGTRYGIADMLAYDVDTGFCVACGKIDKGMERVAEYVAGQDGILVSHGMPSKEIRRAKDDPTVITRYRSKEISTLPAWAAANKHTGFITIKEADMQIPEHKLEELQNAGFDTGKLAEMLASKKQAAVEEERESKEAETEDEKAVVEEAAPEAPPEPAAVAFDPTTLVDDIASAINAAIEPLAQRLDALEQGAKERKEREESPALTFAELLKTRVVGSDEARVDGRTAEAKDRPAENKGQTPTIMNSGSAFADGLINRLISGQSMEELTELYQQ